MYGQGAAIWDECTILGNAGARGWSFITAHTGNISDPGSVGGNRSAYLVRNSRLPHPQGARLGETWLGRPWGTRATVIYMNTYLGEHISSAGWNAWYTKCAHNATSCADIFYAEYNSSGPGAAPEERVHWSTQLNESEAAAWSPSRVLHGWIPPEPTSVWASSR